MQLNNILFSCLLAAVANLVGSAKIFGGAGIDSQSAGVQAGVTFPKIPGINSPILGLSIFPTASSTDNWNVFNNLFPRTLSNNNNNDTVSSDQNQTSTTPSSNQNQNQNQSSTTSSSSSSSNQNENSTTSSSNQNQSSTTPSSNKNQNQSNTTSSGDNKILSFIKRSLNSMLPNINRLVPNLQNISNNISVPSIQGPPSLDSLPNIPGLTDAIIEARNHVQIALNATNDFADGIGTALEQALNSTNPTNAVRTLVNTILNAYLTVAENCPMIVVATRVLREGIRLAVEVARSARNVAFGTQ